MFSAGEILFEVETDKAQIEVEAPDDGRLVKLLNSGEGSEKTSVNSVIAYITDDPDEEVKDFKLPAQETSAPKSESKPASKPVPTVASAPSIAVQKDEPVANMERVGSQTLSPAVARLVHQYHIEDYKVIPASGPRGRLLKGDVLSWIASEKLTKPAVKELAVEGVAQFELNVQSLVDSKSLTRGVVEKILSKAVNKAATTAFRDANVSVAFDKSIPGSTGASVNVQGLDKYFRQPAPRKLSIAEEVDFFDYLVGKSVAFEPAKQVLVDKTAKSVRTPSKKDPLMDFLAGSSVTLYKSASSTTKPKPASLKCTITYQPGTQQPASIDALQKAAQASLKELLLQSAK